MKTNKLHLNEFEVVELSQSEKREIDGGGFWATAGAVALYGGKALAVAGMCAGGLIVGAAVGYGVYKLVQHVTE